MPPTTARGKVFLGLTVSSATFAAFSNPVIAKNDSATPAMIASAGLPSAVKSPSVEKLASPRAKYQTPMIITITSPATSTTVITMLTTTDSVMPTKLTTASTAMNASVMTSAGERSQTSWKYDAKPFASDPAAAKLAESMHTVARNVSGRLRDALFTYSAAPAACGYFVTSSA